MTHLTPCRFCGEVSEVEIRRPIAATGLYYIRHDCRGPYRESEDAAAAEWNAANAPAEPVEP